MNARGIIVGWLVLSASVAGAEWTAGTLFTVQTVNGRPGLVAPDGQPFKSVGMVWAYGPERGPDAGRLTVARLTNELQRIKDLGFNTLNLYGDQLIPEMLEWCDRNELAVYFRTSYYALPDFPEDLKEYPDYMDPSFRMQAADHYREFLKQIKDHPSVLAVDMDHRWLFPLDWSGGRRVDQPKIRPHGVKYLPVWLKDQYGTIERFNAARGTRYPSFRAILNDASLIRDGVVQTLTNHPARVDLYLYTLWTAQDFLAELAAALQAEVPGLLITPTTEHPEVLPETNPPLEWGIAFMSPVHYNKIQDYEVDPISLCKLIYETRWHYDMQGGPVYISETGWRTDPLEQHPPNLAYAYAQPPDPESAARFYATQTALLNVLPWISGYGYFKLYDKWPEGDFGYLNDDGSKKPMAHVGDAINQAFQTADLPDPEPAVWIFYPDYAQASPIPGFEQFKTWLYFRQRPFLDELNQCVDRHWAAIRSGDPEAGARFAEDVTNAFHERWRPFAFTRTIPDDDKPILLFSSVLDILDPADRETLLARKTVAFGPVGLRDTAMRETDGWMWQALGLSPRLDARKIAWIPGGPQEFAAWTSRSDLRALLETGKAEPAVFEGQTLPVPAQDADRLILLAGATGGNAAPSIELHYADGQREQVALGPTISDERHAPALTPGLSFGGRHVSEMSVPLQGQRRLAEIRLPDEPDVRLYLAALTYEDASSGVVQLASSVEGETPWYIRLKEESDLDVLRRFANGLPAVVRKGDHVVFLYDPMVWPGAQNSISRHTAFHVELLEEILNE